MSNEVQEVEVVETEAPEASQVEKPDIAQSDAGQVVDTEQGQEAEQVEETVEVKLDRLEKQREADQRKIDRQRKALSAENKTRADLTARIQAYEKQVAKETNQEEPSINDFDSVDEYEAAKETFLTTKIKSNLEREMLQKESQRQHTDKIKNMEVKFLQDEAEIKQVYPDYDDAAEEFKASIQSMQIPENVRMTVLETAHREGNAAQLIHYFGANGGANIHEFEALAQMQPTQAAVEVYKISQKLSRPSAPTPKKPLPKPPQRATGTGKVKTNTAKLSTEEYIKFRNSQKRK